MFCSWHQAVVRKHFRLCLALLFGEMSVIQLFVKPLQLMLLKVSLTESFAQHLCSICYEPLTEPFVANSRCLYCRKCCDCQLDTSKNGMLHVLQTQCATEELPPSDSEHSQSTLLGLQERLQVGQ